MLVALSVRGFPLVDGLKIEFGSGLNVLTGETGAGKTVLLDALSFALGGKLRATLDQEAEVEAVFVTEEGHPARAVLSRAGLADNDDVFVRRRAIGGNRSVAYVNDRRCSVSLLQDMRRCLVEIQGQKDDRGLLDAAAHLGLLDDFANLGEVLTQCRIAWSEWRDAQRALADSEARRETNRADEANLRHAVHELEELAVEDEEDAQLEVRRRNLKASAKFGEELNRAAELLGSSGADTMMADAFRWLENARDAFDGSLDDCVMSLERSMAELDEACRALDRVRSDLQFDPLELERVEERLFRLREVARKHATTPSELNDRLHQLIGQLQALDQSDGEAALLADAVGSRQKTYDRLAGDLSRRRKQAGEQLDGSMSRELAPLKLGQAVFQTDIATSPPSARGHDDVAFTVATIPGAAPGPIGRIASGGELSRFLLALKLCLASQNTGQCLIFDEIDRGVGGATADAIGLRLRRLAASSQTIVVTHSPQVAAYGECHWVVERIGGRTVTARARRVDGDERRDEIARMLSGRLVTDESIIAADALIRKSSEAFEGSR